MHNLLATIVEIIVVVAIIVALVIGASGSNTLQGQATRIGTGAVTNMTQITP